MGSENQMLLVEYINPWCVRKKEMFWTLSWKISYPGDFQDETEAVKALSVYF